MKCDVVFQVNSPRWRITQKMMAVLMPCCLYNGNLKRLTWNCDSWVQPGTALAWILLSLSAYRRSWNHKTGWFADSWSFVFSSGLTKTRGSEIKCCLFSNKIFSCFSLHLLFFHESFCILCEESRYLILLYFIMVVPWDWCNQTVIQLYLRGVLGHFSPAI